MKYLYLLSFVFFVNIMYSQNYEHIKKLDTLYIYFKDSIPNMEHVKIVSKYLLDNRETEFNHFYIYFFNRQDTIYKDYFQYNDYFQLVNTKNKDLIEKINKKTIHLINKKAILDYSIFKKLGYKKSMELLKNKTLFVLFKEKKLFKKARLYKVNILNYSLIRN